MKRRMRVIAALAVVVGATLAPAPGAHAANAGAAVGDCQVTFPSWPGRGQVYCGTGDLPTEGKAVGAFLPGGPVCLPLCDLNLFFEYEKVCLPPAGPISLPPGEDVFSFGALTVSSVTASKSVSFDALRVGTVIVLTFGGGMGGGGVAGFVPDPRGIPTCAQPGQLKAHIVGLTLAAQ